MIHTLHPLDLVRFGFKGNLQGHDWAQTLDTLGRGLPKDLSSITLLKKGVPTSTRRCTLIWEDRGRVLGLATCRMRSGPSAWEVEHLYLAPDAQNLGPELAEKLGAAAAERGAQKLFLRLPSDSPLREELARAGFLPLFRESLYVGEGKALGVTAEPPVGLRPRNRRDELGLFQLYTFTVPPRVRSWVATTMEEWRDSQEKTGGLVPDMVLESQGEKKAWFRIWKHSLTTYFALLSSLGEEQNSKLLDCAISQLKGQQKAYSLIPEFQGSIAYQLQERGFSMAAEYDHMVKSVVVKVKEAQPAPAQI